MKKLLILLFSLFLLSSTSVFADSNLNFQIEGIGIGDSLLDYMTEDEILEEIELNKNSYSYLKEPNKYASVYLFKDFPIYKDGVSVFIKNNPTSKYITDINEKYTILSIRGMINYIEDFDSCMVKKDEVVDDLSKMFPDAQKTERITKHAADLSGNSIGYVTDFNFTSGGDAKVYCTNFEENFRIKMDWSEGLNVSIFSKEIVSWFNDMN
jgi:hypothetical protein